MTSSHPSTVTLRALDGARPLDDPMVRRTVVAAAHAVAERNAVTILRLESGADSVTVTLDAPRLAAIGFAAELRRITAAWYAVRHPGAALWGEARADDDEDDPYGLFTDPGSP